MYIGVEIITNSHPYHRLSGICWIIKTLYKIRYTICMQIHTHYAYFDLNLKLALQDISTTLQFNYHHIFFNFCTYIFLNYDIVLKTYCLEPFNYIFFFFVGILTNMELLQNKIVVIFSTGIKVISSIFLK